MKSPSITIKWHENPPDGMKSPLIPLLLLLFILLRCIPLSPNAEGAFAF
jgi:hypothetical protein